MFMVLVYFRLTKARKSLEERSHKPSAKPSKSEDKEHSSGGQAGRGGQQDFR